MTNRHAIPGFSAYTINPMGEIAWLRYPAGRMVKQQLQHGLFYVQIIDDSGCHRKIAVRHLVMLTFCGPLPECQRIYHRDGDKGNHRLDNLYYGPLKQHLPRPQKGRAIVKLSAADVSEIRRLCAAGEVRADIARQFGVHPSTVTLIMNGKRHGNDLRREGAEEV